MDQNDGAFYARPESEICRAYLKGCTGQASVRIHCNVEGMDVTVCDNCARVWRLNATAEGLYNRCPRCATWQPATREHREAPAAPAILEGAVADAIEQAMHREGLMIDVRTAVLRRLAREARWLATVELPVDDPFDDEPTQGHVDHVYKSPYENVPTGSVL